MHIGIVGTDVNKVILINVLVQLANIPDNELIIEIIGVKEEPMPIHYITNVYEKQYDVRPLLRDFTEPWQEFKHSPYKSKKASIKRKKRK